MTTRWFHPSCGRWVASSGCSSCRKTSSLPAKALCISMLPLQREVRCWFVNQLQPVYAYTEDKGEISLFESFQCVLADHSPVGNHTEIVNTEAFSYAVVNRQQGFDIFSYCRSDLIDAARVAIRRCFVLPLTIVLDDLKVF